MSEKDEAYAPDEAEAAFRRADDGYTFLGKKLEPFSFLRQTALIALSLKMGLTRSVEAATALWLMTQPDQIVRKARQNPDDFVEEIDAYGEKNGLGGIAGPNFQAAILAFEAVVEDVKAGTGRVVSPDSEEHEGGN